MKKVLFFCFVVTLIVLFNKEVLSATPKIERSEGVELYTCYMGNLQVKGWIKNTNKFSVRIQQVSIAKQSGETTKSIDLLKPNAKLIINDSAIYRGLYIYTAEGIKIGWIRSFAADNKCIER